MIASKPFLFEWLETASESICNQSYQIGKEILNTLDFTEDHFELLLKLTFCIHNLFPISICSTF